MDQQPDAWNQRLLREEEERFQAIARDFAKRQRSRIRTQHVKSLLNRITASRGLAETQTSGQLERAWKSVAGNLLAARSRAGAIRNGVLQVTVSQSVVAQELGFRKTDLIQQLQSILPDAGIRDLRFRVGTIQSDESTQ